MPHLQKRYAIKLNRRFVLLTLLGFHVVLINVQMELLCVDILLCISVLLNVVENSRNVESITGTNIGIVILAKFGKWTFYY